MAYRNHQRFSLGPIGFLIVANIILFIATMINRDLRFFLGLRPDIFLDRPWSLVTSLFIHGDWWHILANMLTFYFFGGYLARLLGTGRLLTIYFCGGILGSIFYLLLGPPSITAIGASGAVFALGGVLAVLRPKLRVFVFPIPVPLPLWVAVVGGFLIISLFPQVAWQAHLGGIICGLVAGLFLRKRERRLF